MYKKNSEHGINFGIIPTHLSWMAYQILNIKSMEYLIKLFMLVYF